MAQPPRGVGLKTNGRGVSDYFTSGTLSPLLSYLFASLS